MKINGLRLYSSILGYGSLRFAVFAKSRKEASRLIAKIANDVELCPWHYYRISEVYDCLRVSDSLTGLVVFQDICDVREGRSCLDPRLIDTVRLDILRLRSV